MYCLNDYKKNGAILESPKSDVLRNIIQAHFFHTLSHSSVFHSVKIWTSMDVLFLQPCSLGVTKEKTLQNPSMLYLGSGVFGRVLISRES